MQAQKSDAQRRLALRPLVAALAAAAACAAAAADEPNPYYIGVRQELTHDSNVYRVPDGISDNYATTSVFGGIDQPIGRQRVYARADIGYSKYQREDQLDNTHYGATAGWDWQTIANLSGNVYASATRGLGNQYNVTGNTQRVKDIVNADQVGASVRWGGDAPVNLEAAYSHSRVRYSAPESLAGESSTDSGSLAAYYRLSPDLRVGVAVRATRKEAPYGVAIVPFPTSAADYRENNTNGRNLDFLINWRYSAQSGVDARLSWTRETNSAVEARDFSGLTGYVAANYAPTAKLALRAVLARDANTTSSFFTYTAVASGIPFSVNGVAEGRQTTDSLSLAATYAATAKINVDAQLQYRRGKLVNSATIGAGSATDERNDTVRSASLGATWAIARAWDLGCRVARESRTIGGAFSYDANVASCFAQFTLR